jgi:hypothetical protein
VPKSLVISHLLLLGVLSAIVYPCAAALWGDATAPGHAWLRNCAVAAVVLAAVMAATEVFSGLRWTAVTVLVTTGVGLVMTLRAAAVTIPGVVMWGIAWLGVAFWFASLAAKARDNR